MIPRISRIELSKLRAKLSKALTAPIDKREDFMGRANGYSRLILRRHGYSFKEYHIDLQTGRIEHNINEDKVQAEIEQHL